MGNRLAKMNKEDTNRIFIAVLFILLAYLSFIILQGFLVSIFIGALLAYIILPAYKRLEKSTGSARVSALILSIIAISALIIMFWLIVFPLAGEFNRFYSFYLSSSPQILEDLSNCSSSDSIQCQIYSYMSESIGEAVLSDAVLSVAKPASEYVINTIVAFISNLPGLLLQLTVVLFSTFYFLSSGVSAVRKMFQALPIKESQKTKIKTRIRDVLNAVIYGNLLTAFIEGVFVALLLYLLDIDLAAIAGLLIMVFALLPPMGAMIVWLPAVGVLVLMKEYVKAVILFVACITVLGYIDNIARPAIISKRVHLSFLWTLLGVFGGLSTFGFVGIIAGPIILSLFVTVASLAGEGLLEAQNSERNNPQEKMDTPETVRILGVRRETHSTKTFILEKRCCSPDFGQFYMVWIPGVGEKPYACSRFSDKKIEITVRHVGPFSEKLHSLKKGDLIGIRGPYGNGRFIPRGKNPCFVAGGLGIAPMISLIEAMKGSGRRVSVITGAKTKDDILFTDRIKESEADLRIVTDDGSAGIKGYPHQMLPALITEKKTDQVYCCGPEVMMRKVLDVVSEKRFRHSSRLNAT